jgi:hypothetical protein
MFMNHSALTVSTVVQSRRGLLRAAGGGALAAIMVGRAAVPSLRAQTSFPTRARVLHASPALGKIEVDFNGVEELDEFTYGMVSDWIEVNPGTARITIHRDRAGINYIVYDVYVPAVPDEDYDLIIADPLLTSPILIPAPVDRSPLPADTSRIGAVHASISLPAIDIAEKGGDVLVDNLQFGQRSDPAEVPAGAYDLEVRVHDTGEVVLDLAGTAFEAGQVYHIVVFGNPGSADTPPVSTMLADQARTSAATATPTD